MKEIDHPKYGKCLELTDEVDVAFSKVVQGSIFTNRVLPSGEKTPDHKVKVVDKYLVDA
jgi:hypothetical protein